MVKWKGAGKEEGEHPHSSDWLGQLDLSACVWALPGQLALL